MATDPLCQAVRGLKATRKVAVQTRSFLASLGFVAATPLIATVPASVLDDATATNPDLVSFELPFEVPPVTTRMYWAERLHRDPRNAWLRKQVIEVARSHATHSGSKA